MAFDFIDDWIGRRSSGGDSYGVICFKPFDLEVIRRLNVMNPRTEKAASFNQFVSVVAADAADHNDHVALARQIDGGLLPLLGRLAYRVNEANLRFWKSRLNQRHKFAHPFDWLRGLRSYSKS